MITKLAESSAPDHVIMSLSGHLSKQMLERYSHIRAAAKRQAVESLSGFVPQGAEPRLTNQNVAAKSEAVN